jgi:uncharacterized membrane protein YgcG
MDSRERASRRPSTPRSIEQLRARALARDRREAMRRRTRRIRRSVASLAAVLFSTAFLVIYVQLASGHDPALVANAKRAAATTVLSAGGKTSSSETSTSSSASESSSGSTSSSSDKSSSGVGAVTTSQS